MVGKSKVRQFHLLTSRIRRVGQVIAAELRHIYMPGM